MKIEGKNLNEIQIKLQNLQREELSQERKDKIKTRDDFESKTNIKVYTSDDYCGLELDGVSFYYGYEATECPIKSHKTEQDCDYLCCDKREWCFTVNIKDKEMMKIPTSKLHPERGEEPFWYLVAGIGHYLSSPVLGVLGEIESTIDEAK